MKNSIIHISFLLFHMTFGRKVALTEFNRRGHQNPTVSENNVDFYSCLLQCERDSLCARVQLDSEDICILSPRSDQVVRDEEEDVFIKGKVLESCSTVLISGIYTVSISEEDMTSTVYCQIDETGKWTVIQRRKDGSENFYRDWATYKSGFGDLRGEFWLGNDVIHHLTSRNDQTLRVDMEDWEGTKFTVYYHKFTVADESDKYRLNVGEFDGTSPPGDAFKSASYGLVNNMQFTTFDSDNDDSKGTNCAVVYTGAWWYHHCHAANPNGQYNVTGNAKGVTWEPWKTNFYSLKSISLMLGTKTKLIH